MVPWSKVADKQKPHWRALGWDEGTWGGWLGLGAQADKVRTTNLSWDELSYAEQSAAKSLGYDEKTWREGVGPTGKRWVWALVGVLVSFFFEERREKRERKAEKRKELQGMWDRTQLSVGERSALEDVLEELIDARTDKTWMEHPKSHARVLKGNAEFIVTNMLELFLDLAEVVEDEKPYITQNVWLEHTSGLPLSKTEREASHEMFRFALGVFALGEDEGIDFGKFAIFLTHIGNNGKAQIGNNEPVDVGEIVPEKVAKFRSTWISTVHNGALAREWTWGNIFHDCIGPQK